MSNQIVGFAKSALLNVFDALMSTQAIDNFSSCERNTDKPLRLPISDVFKARSGSIVVGGKVEAGAFKVCAWAVAICHVCVCLNTSMLYGSAAFEQFLESPPSPSFERAV